MLQAVHHNFKHIFGVMSTHNLREKRRAPAKGDEAELTRKSSKKKVKKVKQHDQTQGPGPETKSAELPPAVPSFGDETKPVKKDTPKSIKVSLQVTYGALSVDDKFYLNPSSSKLSETSSKKDCVSVERDADGRVEFARMWPDVERLLQQLKYPVMYDTKEHALMTPSPDRVELRVGKKEVVYHPLNDFNPNDWFLVNDGVLNVSVVSRTKTPVFSPSASSSSSSSHGDVTAGHSSEDSEKRFIKVVFYFGGRSFRGELMADHVHAKKSKTQEIGSQMFELPIHKSDIVDAASSLMLKSSLHCTLGDHHVVSVETLEMVPSQPEKKKVTTPYLPKCVPLEDTFEIPSDYVEKSVKIVIHDTNAAVTSSSYFGGSHADHDDSRVFSINQWAAKLAVASIVGSEEEDKDCLHGMTIFGDTPEELKTSAVKLADYLLSRSTDIPHEATPDDYAEALDAEFRKLVNDPTSYRPAAAFVFSEEGNRDIKSEVSTSTSSNAMTLQEKFLSDGNDVTSKSPLVLARLSGTTGNTASRTTEWLQKGEYSLDVMVNEDCGKQKHLKKGTWCSLNKIHSGGKAFAVTPILTEDSTEVQQSINIHWKHFYYVEDRDSDELSIDTDDSDSEK
jgi:hypothetical protein